MRRISHAPPPKPKREQPAPALKPATVIVRARTNKQIAKAKRIERLRERGY